MNVIALLGACLIGVYTRAEACGREYSCASCAGLAGLGGAAWC